MVSWEKQGISCLLLPVSRNSFLHVLLLDRWKYSHIKLNFKKTPAFSTEWNHPTPRLSPWGVWSCNGRWVYPVCEQNSSRPSATQEDRYGPPLAPQHCSLPYSRLPCDLSMCKGVWALGADQGPLFRPEMALVFPLSPSPPSHPQLSPANRFAFQKGPSRKVHFLTLSSM